MGRSPSPKHFAIARRAIKGIPGQQHKGTTVNDQRRLRPAGISKQSDTTECSFENASSLTDGSINVVGSRTPVVSIIIPVLNEAANVDPLVQRIRRAMKGHDYEIVIVDDGSTDDTLGQCYTLIGEHPIRVFSRQSPSDGLSGAVMHGFSKAGGQILVAMDADLQHPPEALPSLIAPLLSGQADFVLGSRYVPGAVVALTWGRPRMLLSRAARALSRPLVGALSDPMSGFFALLRERYERSLRVYNPIGYKIALEVLCKCEIERIVEIPIHFGARTHGRSKLCLVQKRDYLRHLWRLYHYKYPCSLLIAQVGLISSGLLGLVLTARLLLARIAGRTP